MRKAELRKIYLARQKSLAREEREKKSRRIAAQFFQNFDLDRICFLHCFLPIKKFNEVDTEPILYRIWQNFPQITTLAPRVNFHTKEIESLKFTPETELARNVWQIYEPACNEMVEAEKIDLVLVPLLCFDRRGFRVGYGKGFYDRFLKNCRADCMKIGVSYFAPAEIEDINNFDEKLNYCVTPEKIWSFTSEDELY